MSLSAVYTKLAIGILTSGNNDMDVKRFIASLFVAAVISLVIFLTLNDFGIAWDEPDYMQHGDGYVSWLKQPTQKGIEKYFRASLDMHPPFRKFIAGMTHEVLTTNLHIIDNTRGYRISSLFFVFPFVAALTYIAIGQFGYVIGLLVPFMFSFLPHVLYLTSILTLDYAIAVLWFFAVISGIKGAKHLGWLTVSGVCIGLTLLTKLHGFILFIPVAAYLIWYIRKRSALVRLAYVTALAFTTYIIGWPWLWTSTVVHITEYFSLHRVFVSVPEYIFGQTYMAAPWWYTPVMFLVTTPAFILFLFFVGAWWAIRKGRIWDRVMLANALFPIVFFSLPWVYRHDWVRLFLPAYPFVVLVAGLGLTVSIKSLRSGFRKAGFVVLVLLWGITVYTSVVRIHPWESSYYNELVGGVSGAARLGFETEYWGNAYLGVLPWMNEHKDHMMCVSPTTNPFYYYQAMGQIESGVVFNAGRNVCDYLIILMRQGFFIKDSFINNVVRTQKSIYSVSLDGVPLVGVYDIRNIKE